MILIKILNPFFQLHIFIFKGMTCHWVDKQYKINNVVLGCFLHEGESQSESLVDDFAVKIFRECGFDMVNISAVVSDTTGNMNKFGKMLEDLNIPHIYCTDHVLQLTAKIAYYEKDIDDGPQFDIMKKVRRLIDHFSRSHLMTEKLKKAQKNLDEFDGQVPLRIKTDVKTRWWSTYASIERLIKLKRVFRLMEVQDDLTAEMIPTEIEWKILEQVCAFLKPFKLVMKRLEGEKYSTIGLVPSCITYLRKSMNDFIQEHNIRMNRQNERNFLEYIVKNMKIDFDERWGEDDDPKFEGVVVRGNMDRQIGIHTVIAVACALDPRSKALSAYSDEEKDHIWDMVTNFASEYSDMNHIYVLPLPLDDADNVNRGVPNVLNDIENDDNVNELDAYLREANQDENLNGNGQDLNVDNQNGDDLHEDDEPVGYGLQKCIEEIEKYRNLRPLPYNENGNVLCPLQDFWKLREHKFPVLSGLARKFLAVPATSAPSERVFSSASRNISKDRNRLSAETAGTQIFLCKILEWYDDEMERNGRN